MTDTSGDQVRRDSSRCFNSVYAMQMHPAAGSAVAAAVTSSFTLIELL